MKWFLVATLCIFLLLGTTRGQRDDEDIEEEMLTDEQLRALHQKFDQDGNGKVSLAEIMAFASEMGRSIAARDISAILEEIDLDKDGKLSLEEHLTDIENQAEGGDEEEKQEMRNRKRIEEDKFMAADVNQDKVLDVDEVASLFYPETHEGVLAVTVAETMRQKDRNQDGKLSPREFWEVEGTGEDAELTEEEKQDFAKLDLNGDGVIDMSELRLWESGKFHTEEAMKAIFESADKDNDLHITADELTQAKSTIALGDAQYHLLEWAEHNEL
mmetsp:Transcript_11288/g.24880  ORF Transcript_11288/g.24880 Transcript_11288/m.24880 type:complete len:272 (-) Transcript_11288:52-867(-)